MCNVISSISMKILVQYGSSAHPAVQCGADKFDIFIKWIITSININQVEIYKNI